MSSHDELKPYRQQLIGHGALMIFCAGVIGFGFLFFLIGSIKLWPIPGELDIKLPGSYDDWRMAHMEAVVNGTIMWIMAAILPLLPFSPTGQRRAAYGMIVVAWTFIIASAMKPLFPNSRGLAASDLASNNIVFGLFYVGVVLVMLIMGLIAYRSLRGDKAA